MKKYLFVLISALFLSSCTEVVIVGTLSAAYFIRKDKSFSKIIDDTKIFFETQRTINANNTNNRFSYINISVNEGRVLLVGFVADDSDKQKASSLIASNADVTQVLNEINVVDKITYTMKDRAKDSLVTMEIKARLSVASGVKSNNYKVETVKGSVYLLGIASSTEELKNVSYIARSTLGVHDVVDHVRLITESTSRKKEKYLED